MKAVFLFISASINIQHDIALWPIEITWQCSVSFPVIISSEARALKGPYMHMHRNTCVHLCKEIALQACNCTILAQRTCLLSLYIFSNYRSICVTHTKYSKTGASHVCVPSPSSSPWMKITDLMTSRGHCEIVQRSCSRSWLRIPPQF